MCVGTQQCGIEPEKFGRLIGGLVVREPLPRYRADNDKCQTPLFAGVIVKFLRPPQPFQHNAAESGGREIADETKANMSKLIRHPGVGISSGRLDFLAVNIGPELGPKILCR